MISSSYSLVMVSLTCSRAKKWCGSCGPTWRSMVTPSDVVWILPLKRFANVTREIMSLSSWLFSTNGTRCVCVCHDILLFLWAIAIMCIYFGFKYIYFFCMMIILVYSTNQTTFERCCSLFIFSFVYCILSMWTVCFNNNNDDGIISSSGQGVQLNQM